MITDMQNIYTIYKFILTATFIIGSSNCLNEPKKRFI